MGGVEREGREAKKKGGREGRIAGEKGDVAGREEGGR